MEIIEPMDLNSLRDNIDVCDREIIRLLNERTEHVLEIGRIKRQTGEETYVPSRERSVFDKVTGINKGPLPDASLKAIYREIMSASLALERDVRIAYLGPPATFTHLAARSKFGASVDYFSCGSISDVFAMVSAGSVDYGVVPVENSTEGAVTHTFDQFCNTSLKICAEVYLRISLNLLSMSSLDKIKRVYSKQEALGQCRHWLDSNIPGAVQIPVDSTVHAAEKAQQEPGSAAVASAMAAEIYKVPIVMENIQDISGNTTRFIILGKKCSGPTGKDKTSILFSVKHRAGALYNALAVFYQAGVNMTKIESRPSKSKAWEYNFFVDIEGHSDDQKVRDAVQELESHCTMLQVLGSYPGESIEGVA